MKGLNALAKFLTVLHNAHGGQDTEKFPFSFLHRHGNFVQALLTAHKRVNSDGQVIGVFFFLQTASPELQQALDVHSEMEKNCLAAVKELVYVFNKSLELEEEEFLLGNVVNAVVSQVILSL
ncbi:hypothetical protein K1719_046930 [Acacia pycnantha]|nr:hypothetical protein K1719_046930 [Acacia pycnantha]